LVVYSVTGFSGYALLLPVAPLWAVNGGAGAAGSGLVNGVLLATTVLTQLAVPWTLRTLGHGRTMALGLVLMAAGAALVASDALAWILACSVVRGVGFGILTVTGSAVVGHLSPPALRGRMVGIYGLAVAVPNLVLLPAGVPAVDLVGFEPVLLLAALPLLGIPAALALGRLVRPTPSPAAAVPGAPHPATGPTAAAAAGGLLAAVVPPTAVLLAATMAGGALLTFLPQVSSSGTAGLALLLMGAAAAASRFGAGHLADAGPRGGQPWMAPLLLMTAAGTTACAWSARDGSTGWLLVGALLCGTGYGALQNLTLVSAFHRAGPGRVDETSTLWNVGFDGGTALGAVLVGVAASLWGFPTAFAAAGVGCVLALAAARASR
jgi:MFS family permease